jgi:hypothetical protein
MIYRGSLLDQKQGHLSMTVVTGIYQRSISILREMRGDQGTGNSHIILMIYRGSILDQKQGHLSMTIATGIYQRSMSILREMRGDQGQATLTLS